MSENRRVNTFLLGLGVVAGALGAWFFSKKENRALTSKTVSRARKQSRGLLIDLSKSAKKAVADARALAKQKKIDAPIEKKTPVKKK